MQRGWGALPGAVACRTLSSLTCSWRGVAFAPWTLAQLTIPGGPPGAHDAGLPL